MSVPWSSDWKKASPQILIIFSLFGFLSLSVFWASMLTLTVRLPRVQESWHLSQVNYLRFMYCHGDAGRFECLRIQFGTTRADQNCKQMSLHASLCFSCTSDLCLWWHYTSKLELFQLQHECSHRYIRSQCHTLHRERKCLYSYTYSAFIHFGSVQKPVRSSRNGASLNTGVAQHQRHCDKHITSCPAYASSGRLYTYMYIQSLLMERKAKTGQILHV